jgi:hypothetical protein
MDYLRATSDDEMGKIGPSPSGCGVNPAILRCHPRRWNPPQPSDSASSGPIFVRNATHAKVNNRL